ncbi:MAG: TlpA disulfide reductase family protein [Chloroflexi bacterium]|nr:TlpA disulfide reductase family protein [Chloroflexota bacterium]MCY4248524.1 TlpA disulfide reductase family protein [Chloroflexota bacterium]
MTRHERATPRIAARWGCSALLLGVIATTVILGAQLAERNRGRPASGPAPDFQLQLFTNEHIELNDLRGQVVLLNFWASWCPPCRAEAPDLQALHEDFAGSGLRVIGVNMLESSPAKAQAFVDELGIGYANGEDIEQRIARLYRVEAPPESFLVDRRGQVRQVYIGSITYDMISGNIQSLLAEAA